MEIATGTSSVFRRGETLMSKGVTAGPQSQQATGAGAARVTEHTKLSESSLPSLHCFLAKLFPILELNA